MFRVRILYNYNFGFGKIYLRDSKGFDVNVGRRFVLDVERDFEIKRREKRVFIFKKY